MISIVIPSHNSEKTIEKTIKSVLNQDYTKRYEVLVIDSSKDRTPEIVSKYPVKLIRQKPKGPSAARNLGVKKAKGGIVVFIDADCIAPKNWLKNLVKSFSNKEIAAVAGGYRVKNKESLVARFANHEINERHERMNKLKKIDFVGSFNCAYRKKIFQKFGGFDTKFIQAEDADLSFRVSEKNRMVFEPSAPVYHYHPDSLLKYLRQKFWRGHWKIFLYARHKKKRLGSTYTPPTLSFQMLFTSLFALFLLLGIIGTNVHVAETVPPTGGVSAVWTGWLSAISVSSVLFLSISLVCIVLVLLMNTRFIDFLLRKEPKILFAAIPIIFLRNTVVIIGGGYGLMKLIKKEGVVGLGHKKG